MAVVFDIKDLDLGYGDGKTVLRIDDCAIERGKLTFVTGPSGVGKSTLLETLGLMKNTMLSKPGAKLDFNAHGQASKSLIDLWDSGPSEANTLRSHYFSFIFQSTNLMPNFTLGENICFTGMLNGASLKEVKTRALSLMEELNLETSLFDQKANMASGGQRQRAAFVRALCKDFEVLFGDEPTGNLDKDNAISLFEMLRAHVKNENKSALIVSHDIELSERFADEIINIEQHVEEEIGHIKTKHR